jgi:4-hydroxybutyrate dehydrogenase / sulfolactaldehyde 3-reductase
MNEIERVGFIGLGTMGSPMAKQIVDAGYDLVVYDVDRRAVDRLRQAGAREAADPSEAASKADVTISMLPDPDAVRAVLLGHDGVIHGAPAGSIVVDMSTSGPDVVRECARALAERDVAMLDAPVGKGPWAAEKGELTVLAGGDLDVLRRVEPVLRCVGSEIHHCGPLGSGQVIKLANNLVACANMAVLAEAYSLTRREGADTEILVKLMPHTSADSWQLRQTLIGKILEGDLTPMFKLKLAAKDMRLLAQLAEGLDVRFDCGRGALHLYEEAEELGHGELDWGAVVLVDEPDVAPPPSN